LMGEKGKKKLDGGHLLMKTSPRPSIRRGKGEMRRACKPRRVEEKRKGKEESTSTTQRR